MVAVAAAVHYLPQLADASGQASLVPASTSAVQTEVTATHIFGEPLDAQAVAVQRAPRGLSQAALANAVRTAAAVDTGRARGGPIEGLAGVLPIPNVGGAFPGSRERSTTVVTFLYFRAGTPAGVQTVSAEQYAKRYLSAPADHLIGVTGALPGLAPALIGIFGSALFWPGPHWLRAARSATTETGAGTRPKPRSPWAVREAVARFAAVRPIALVIVAASVVGLLAAALDATGMRLGAPLVTALPASSQPARAQAAAGRGFAVGVLSPAEILVMGRGVATKSAGLDRLQAELESQPGVAGVVGPATLPAALAKAGVPAAVNLPNPMLARSGNAARFGIIEGTDPLGPTAVRDLARLQARLGSLVRSAGLTGVRIEVGGETAAVGAAVGSTTGSLAELAPIMLVITFVLLALFLRALIAPLYLLAASVLSLLATLGVTVWIFQHRLGYDGLMYYVPFTLAVLLISLGADYNVFVVGRIWEEARRRPLRDAIAVAGSQASRAITVAGLALATSFALLALIPLQQFREVAVGMAAGIVIDAIIARSLLVPALVALFGRAGMWPGRPGHQTERPPPATPLSEPGA
jgi:RND superfamily putative drug exporter